MPRPPYVSSLQRPPLRRPGRPLHRRALAHQRVGGEHLAGPYSATREVHLERCEEAVEGDDPVKRC